MIDLDFQIIQQLGYIFSAMLFIYGLKMLSKEDTAARGNLVSSTGMFLAVLVTIVEIINTLMVISTIVLGGLIGSLFVYLFQAQINIKKLKPFVIGFIFFFFLSPALYAYVSISKDDKRTDYPGKEIAAKTQYTWDQQFNSIINVVLGDE